MQHTPPYALVLVFARGTLCRCQGAYCSEVTVVHTADRSGPMCTPIGADDGREKSAPQTRSQRYHAWCALSVARPARTQAGCAPAVGSPKRNYNCTGHKLPLSFSGASTTRGREKQRRGRIHWPPKHRFLATLQHSGAYRRTCTTPPVARPACGAPACFFFLPPPAACVCIKRGNKRKKKNGNLNPANAPPHKHPHNARHTHAPLSCVLSYPGTIASHAACENVAQRCARCPVAGPPVSTAFSCRATRLAWGAAPSERRNTSPAPALLLLLCLWGFTGTSLGGGVGVRTCVCVRPVRPICVIILRDNTRPHNAYAAHSRKALPCTVPSHPPEAPPGSPLVRC